MFKISDIGKTRKNRLTYPNKISITNIATSLSIIKESELLRLYAKNIGNIKATFHLFIHFLHLFLV